MILANNISLSFTNGQVFKDFSFEIKKNQHVCFAGPSGKGKSSLLKLIQAYVIPQSGSIKVNNEGIAPHNISKIRSLIAYIPQNINLPVENGQELIQLLGMDIKINSISEFLIELDLSEDYLNRSFHEISGGQKQRVVIAVCLALDREIILFDEPTASLDSKSTQKLINLVSKLKNKTIVSASHNNDWINAAEKVINL